MAFSGASHVCLALGRLRVPSSALASPCEVGPLKCLFSPPPQISPDWRECAFVPPLCALTLTGNQAALRALNFGGRLVSMTRLEDARERKWTENAVAHASSSLWFLLFGTMRRNVLPPQRIQFQRTASACARVPGPTLAGCHPSRRRRAARPDAEPWRRLCCPSGQRPTSSGRTPRTR